jgi:hypothetical protein
VVGVLKWSGVRVQSYYDRGNNGGDVGFAWEVLSLPALCIMIITQTGNNVQIPVACSTEAKQHGTYTRKLCMYIWN